MGLLWTSLWWLAAGVVCLVMIVAALFIVLVIILVYQFEKFMFKLPWLKWLTLDDLPALGFSKLWARMVLPHFYNDGYLEVRLKDEDGMDDFDHESVELFGFSAATVPLYEFKLTKRCGPRKKWSFDNFSASIKVLQPVRA